MSAMAADHEPSAGSEAISRDGANDVAEHDDLAEAIDRLMPEEADDDDDMLVAHGGEKKKGPDEERRGKRSKAESGDDEDEPDLEKEEEAELEGDEASEGDDEQASDEKDEEESEDEEDEEMALHRAYTTLHDAGFPTSALKKASKAQLIAWAANVEAKKTEGKDSPESDTDRGRDSEAGKPEGKGAAQPTAAISWATVRAEIAEKMGVDEEAADALKPIFDRGEATEQRLASIEASMKADREASAQREGRNTINTEIRRLAGAYPELKGNTKKREAVTDAALTLVSGLRARGKDVDAEAVFNQAAGAVLGPPKRSDLARLRRNGFATAPAGHREGLGAQRTELEFWDKAITYAEQGRPDLIRRLTPPPETKRPARTARR